MNSYENSNEIRYDILIISNYYFIYFFIYLLYSKIKIIIIMRACIIFKKKYSMLSNFK